MLAAVCILAVIGGLLWKAIGRPSPRHVHMLDMVAMLAASEATRPPIEISSREKRAVSA